MNHQRISSAALFSMLSLSLFASTASSQQSLLFPTCVEVDFNNNSVFPEAQDDIDFFNTLSGGPCVGCDSIDINRNGVFPEDADVELYILAAAGGYPQCDALGFTPVDATAPFKRWVATTGSNTTGDGTAGNPYATVQRALEDIGNQNLHATIYIGAGTYAMAIRGEYTSGIQWGGLSPSQPLTFAPSEGVTERPTLLVPPDFSGFRITDGASFIRCHGLRFVMPNGAQPCVSIIGPSDNVLIEDCVLVGGIAGVQANPTELGGEDLVIRRCIITGQRSGGDSQGIFANSINNTRIEGCALDDNGNRNTFCHGMYLPNGATIYREAISNFVRNPGFAGIQARGGLFRVIDNVTQTCGNGLGFGHPQSNVSVSGEFRNNVVLDSKYPHWGLALQDGLNMQVSDTLLLTTPDVGYAITYQAPSVLDASGNPTSSVTNTRIVGWELDEQFATPTPNIDVSGTTATRGAAGATLSACVTRPVWITSNNDPSLLERELRQWVPSVHDASVFIANIRHQLANCNP